MRVSTSDGLTVYACINKILHKHSVRLEIPTGAFSRVANVDTAGYVSRDVEKRICYGVRKVNWGKITVNEANKKKSYKNLINKTS